MPRLPMPEGAPVQQAQQQAALIWRQVFMGEEYTRTAIGGNAESKNAFKVGFMPW